MLENAPDLHGRSAIAEGIGGMMQDLNFALSFQTDRVTAARSGDLAYETGAYSLTTSNEKKEPVTTKGHYVVVWQKQADGTWKALVDCPVSDPPEASPAS
jgi:ketosteroid isomerase-like protein